LYCVQLRPWPAHNQWHTLLHGEELELHMDRCTKQTGIHQHEICCLQTNLQIAEEAIISFHLELGMLRSEHVCLEEDAHHVYESWALDKHAEREDTELVRRNQ